MRKDNQLMNKPKHNPTSINLIGVAILVLPLIMNACAAESGKTKNAELSKSEKRLVAGELIVNAVKGAEMLGVKMYADGMDRPFYGKARSTYKNTDKMGFPLPRIPQQVRVIWRGPDSKAIVENGAVRYEGTIAGDYTIPVASRIPPSVFEEIERNGGALRIKFRLKPDGVMLGWDIQRMGKHLLESYMPGGDFLDTEY